MQQQQQEQAITNDVSDVGLRDQLILESRIQLEEAIDAIEQERADKNQAANDKFIEMLGERGAAILENLAEQSILEEELERENELRRLEGRTVVLTEENAAEILALERHEEQKQAIRNRHNSIANRGVQITAQFQQQIEQNKTQAIIGLATNLTSQLAGQSRALFNINKAAGIANAIVNTAQGVTEALKLPYPLNLVAAASTAAVGLAEIATIRATSYGGGGGGGGGGIAGAGGAAAINIPEALTVTADTQTEAATQTAPGITINNPTIFTNDSTEMQEFIGPAAVSFIREETNEGDETVIDQGSRQALDLTT